MKTEAKNRHFENRHLAIKSKSNFININISAELKVLSSQMNVTLK